MFLGSSSVTKKTLKITTLLGMFTLLSITIPHTSWGIVITHEPVIIQGIFSNNRLKFIENIMFKDPYGQLLSMVEVANLLIIDRPVDRPEHNYIEPPKFGD